MEELPHIHNGEESSENFQGLGVADEAVVERCSAEYVGRWEKLVSTTNWEKGRIICQWRQDLLAVGALLESCSDEAWSRRTRTVSPQHVGRLRRVFQRFGEIYPQFAGLYWSHFHAALDWDDAEMWLEGAVQSGWSVARMRTERWQAMGAPPNSRPRDEEIVSAERDEDVEPDDSLDEALGSPLREIRSPGADQSDAIATADDGWETPDEGGSPPEAERGEEPVRPFENLPPLPRDLADAVEQFKLAILNHKLSGWREISADDVLTVLDALKRLVLAPA